MNYGQVRDQALMLVNKYTLAGDKIARTYNNQADYLIRIPSLVDEAMQIIASGPRRIQEYRELRLDPTADRLGAPTYTLPEDLMDIVPGGLLVVENPYETPRYDSGWARPDEWHIVFPKRDMRHFHGRVFLEYFRNPHSIMECVNCGMTLDGESLSVPTGATGIRVAGHTDKQTPVVKLVSGGTETNVTLTMQNAAKLNGMTGEVEALDMVLQKQNKVGVGTVTAGTTIKVSGWAKPGDGVFAFTNASGIVSVQRAPTEPPDCAELDNAVETHFPIPYYVAAHLVLDEDAFAYASLENEWTSKIQRLYQLPQPYRHIVEDSYGLDHYYDWGDY